MVSGGAKHKLVFLRLYLIFTIDASNGRWNLSTKEQNALEFLCPYNAICQDGVTKMPFRLIAKDGCCSGPRHIKDHCSCDADCSLTGTCCLPKLNQHNLVDRSHQECLCPATGDLYDMGLTTLNMVVDSFPDGKGDGCGDDVNLCGNDVRASPIGAMFPVFSNRTGRIYKNIKCAKCHGLTDDDVIKFDVWLKCSDIYHVSSVDVSASFYGLESGQLAPNCQFLFSYPGPESDLKSEKCFGHKRMRCLLTFKVDERLNMTQEELRSACEDNDALISPYRLIYKNVFCFECSRDYGISFEYEQTETCPHKTFDIEKIFNSPLISLLEPHIFDGYARNNANAELTFKEHIICLKNKLNGREVLNDCRFIHCPCGKFRGRNGECIDAIKKLNRNKMQIFLKLYPSLPLDETVIQSKNSNIVSVFNSYSPWSSHWNVKLILYKMKEGISVNGVIDYFLVHLKSKIFDSHFKNAIHDIQKGINSNWSIYINDIHISFKQQLSEFVQFGKISFDMILPININQGKEPPAFIKNHSIPTLKILLYSRFQNTLPITKMFFCEQVQLKPDEYEIDLLFGIFYHKMLNRIFYHGEFAYIFDEIGQAIPRICLEDLKLKRQNVNADAPPFQEQMIPRCLCYTLVIAVFHCIIKENISWF